MTAVISPRTIANPAKIVFTRANNMITTAKIKATEKNKKNEYCSELIILIC
jgi:hypothetical protein